MGKNDLWIAASAHALKLRLVTTDKDFSHLKEDFIELLEV
ncbi:MAG: PIN domain-containing protein, partial [Bacteroidetes bacterium]|nr:PIN domain-containing protein [Bacteroidota bacterium]